ncbi:serine/threonine-protein kinase [Novipirellula artificiosorum]|uniref:non-specific serine/threonine protein kinase n=1 Tax=Novipirellula artificiosorum TaxID=2528016 RepID=A0A5C6DAZ6_9BACT|nr:serine/threonine-protein kinase [Novipirellula artificiosorum]TWU32901.1 Serine/threonine-protein kinase PrkC [Novipirellula artificiosorum]
MSSPTSHLDPETLSASLIGELSEDQESVTRDHLSECEVCRVELQRLACGGDWDSIEHALRVEAQSHRSLGTHSASRLIECCENPDTNEPVYPVEYAQSPTDFAISFLEPSNREDSMGQLGEFEVLSVIGFGGMGIVLKGFQEELNRPVAIKVMAPHLATSGVARQRFLREAQATAAIVHPNVMPILSVNEKSSLPFLVMPYVACHSLQQRIDSDGALATVDVLRIALQVAEGLAAAHGQGLVHRDVKPANILLERGVDRAMLTDFGLARAVDDATVTRSGIIAGTPQYMSPEQARGEAVDARSDLFSLGSVIYAMCVGHPPFRGETSYGILRKVTDLAARSMQLENPQVPEWLDRLTAKLMSKEATKRYGSVNEVATLLRQCLAHVQQPTVEALPPSLRTPMNKKGKRQVLYAVLTAATLANAMVWLGPHWKTESSESSIGPMVVPAGSTSNPTALPLPPAVWDDDVDQELGELSHEIDQLLGETSEFPL